ncbi:MAG: CopD family protein [Ilumatobacteraceae bacterium]
MLSPTLTTIRLFVHVLAASVWVGGQIVLAGLVPSLRREYPDATALVARGFARIAWPAFAVIVVTGLWNLTEVDVSNTTTAYQITLFVKITLAIVSGAAAAVHQVGTSKVALAVGGALGLLAALGAMFCGYLLTTGS